VGLRGPQRLLHHGTRPIDYLIDQRRQTGTTPAVITDTSILKNLDTDTVASLVVFQGAGVKNWSNQELQNLGDTQLFNFMA
jgi:hypothetical protein